MDYGVLQSKYSVYLHDYNNYRVLQAKYSVYLRDYNNYIVLQANTLQTYIKDEILHILTNQNIYILLYIKILQKFTLTLFTIINFNQM